MTKIELDTVRIDTYQELKNNLAAVEEFFRHGDILVRQINEVLQRVKTAVDIGEDTSFTEEDFNSMLTARNNILYPIFQSASFAVVFDPYGETPTEEPEPPVVIVEPVTKYTNRISSGILNGTTITTTIGDKPVKVIDLSYNKGILDSNNTVEYLEAGTKSTYIKYNGNTELNHVVTTVTGNTINTTISNIVDGEVVSTTYLVYLDGMLTENTTIVA